MMYKDFRVKVIKAKGKHHFRVKNSYGTKDAYRWCIKNKLITKKITESKFRKIVNTLNLQLQKELVAGYQIKLPVGMGMVSIRKSKTYVGIKDGKIKTNKKVDWDTTLKYWYSDEDAYKNKKLIRKEAKEIFKIIYNKSMTSFKNSTYFLFEPTRTIKLLVKDNIENDNFETLIFNRRTWNI